MCFDMSLFSPLQQIQSYVPVSLEGIHFTPTWHQAAPSFCNWPVVTQTENYAINLMEWGLVADYMQTPEQIQKYRISMANARSEKILDDPASVWHRLRAQRCLIFCDGFFEHQEVGGTKKQAHFIRAKHEVLFAFAGLYHYGPLKDAATGATKGSFSIVTRAANPLMARIHNGGAHKERMPLILEKERAITWLHPNTTDTTLREILQYSFPEEGMDAWPVNSVRGRKTDDARLIQRYETLRLF